jgi:hypothetical protein
MHSEQVDGQVALVWGDEHARIQTPPFERVAIGALGVLVAGAAHDVSPYLRGHRGHRLGFQFVEPNGQLGLMTAARLIVQLGLVVSEGHVGVYPGIGGSNSFRGTSKFGAGGRD